MKTKTKMQKDGPTASKRRDRRARGRVDAESPEPVETREQKLMYLATYAKELADEGDRESWTRLAYYRASGEQLIEAKELLHHGEWTLWLGANFGCSAQTARLYMQLAKKWPMLEAEAKRQMVSR